MNNDIMNNDMINTTIKFIDSLYTSIDLPSRVFLTTCEFIDKWYIDGKGKRLSKKERSNIEGECFKRIYFIVKKWYKDTYSEENLKFESMLLPGIVEIDNALFKLEIPIDFWGEFKNEETRWLHLPKKVLNQEDPFEWIVKPPNLTKKSLEERTSIKENIIFIANTMRAINSYFLCALLENKSRDTTKSILTTIEHCVNNILKLNVGLYRNALWNFHLCLEKALKILILQRGGKIKKIHSLKTLTEKANNISKVSVEESLIEVLPDANTAIQSRYEFEENPNLKNINLQQILTLYKNYMIALDNITKNLKCSLIRTEANTAFLLRKPPYLS